VDTAKISKVQYPILHHNLSQDQANNMSQHHQHTQLMHQLLLPTPHHHTQLPMVEVMVEHMVEHMVQHMVEHMVEHMVVCITTGYSPKRKELPLKRKLPEVIEDDSILIIESDKKVLNSY
jgi:hypothetical protein